MNRGEETGVEQSRGQSDPREAQVLHRFGVRWLATALGQAACCRRVLRGVVSSRLGEGWRVQAPLAKAGASSRTPKRLSSLRVVCAAAGAVTLISLGGCRHSPPAVAPVKATAPFTPEGRW